MRQFLLVLMILCASVTHTYAVVTIVASDTMGCERLTVDFSYTTEGITGISSVEWVFGNGETSDDASPSGIDYTQPGTYNVSLTIEYSGGIQVDDLTISVYPTPDPTFWYEQAPGANYRNITVYNSVQGGSGLPHEEPNTDYTRRWLINLGTTTRVEDENPFTYLFPEDGLFPLSLSVWVTNLPSCRADSSGFLPVYKQVLPIYFTPNNDGRNDIYEIGLDGITEITFEVYSRYGIRVFAQTSPTIQWDGRNLAGNEVSQGVYFYTISCPLSIPELNKTGYIHVFR